MKFSLFYTFYFNLSPRKVQFIAEEQGILWQSALVYVAFSFNTKEQTGTSTGWPNINKLGKIDGNYQDNIL